MAQPTFANIKIKPMEIVEVIIANYSDDKIKYELDQSNKGHLIIKLESAGKK